MPFGDNTVSCDGPGQGTTIRKILMRPIRVDHLYDTGEDEDDNL